MAGQSENSGRGVVQSAILSPMTDLTSPLPRLAGVRANGRLPTSRRAALLIAQADTGGYAGIDPNEAATVECDLLRSIDEAWSEASSGRFGFSAQANALAAARSRDLPRADTWRAFGRTVGWVNGREWIEEDGLSYDGQRPRGISPGSPAPAPSSTPVASTKDSLRSTLASPRAPTDRSLRVRPR